MRSIARQERDPGRPVELVLHAPRALIDGTERPDLPELFAAGVFGVKCFLQDSGVPEFPPVTTAEMRARDAVDRRPRRMLLVHAEDPGVLHTAPTPQGRDYRTFAVSRPESAETAAVQTCIDAATATRCRTYLGRELRGVVRARWLRGTELSDELVAGRLISHDPG